MRLKRGARALQLWSLLGVLGILALWDERFVWFLAFLALGSLPKLRRDERMSQNLARAARNSFYAAMLGLFALNLVAVLKPEITVLGPAIMGLMLGLWLFFTASVIYYERRGD